ncbi:MAG: hypothetical protein IJH77_04925 [Mogibacterium sp.]|nr:hypothetical protein [Mogibacterium sp.]
MIAKLLVVLLLCLGLVGTLASCGRGGGGSADPGLQLSRGRAIRLRRLRRSRKRNLRRNLRRNRRRNPQLNRNPRPNLNRILEAGRIVPTACNYQPHEDVTERAPEGRNAEEAGL